MKNFIFMSAIICTLLFACKKDDQTKGEIFGQWKLTEQYADPGNGTGKYQKVKGETKTVTFHTTGEITGELFTPPTQFKVLDSVRLEITIKNSNHPLIYYYKVTAKELILNPPCIEGCGLKLKRQ